MMKCGVLFEVRINFINIIWTRFGFKGLSVLRVTESKNQDKNSPTTFSINPTAPNFSDIHSASMKKKCRQTEYPCFTPACTGNASARTLRILS
jgi:hypothetical protein